jgi:SEC-C motif-containing protein
VVEAAALERVVHLTGAVGGEDHQRRRLRPDRAQLGDRDGEVGEDLQQERLELVVGPVHLVDEQHAGGVLERLQQRSGEQEAPVVEGGLELLGVVGGVRGLGGPQVEELAAEVPVVERLAGLETLVALQPVDRPSGDLRQRVGQRGLADPGLALQEQGPVHDQREVGSGGQPLVRKVTRALQRGGQVAGPGRTRRGGPRRDGDRLHGGLVHVREHPTWTGSRPRLRPEGARDTRAMPPRRCPCGTGLIYAECCGRLHDELRSGPGGAATAEALMRSRYSAFVLGDAGYLLATWHPTTRPRTLRLDPAVRWTGLDVLATDGGSLLAAEGTVEFRAHYLVSGVPGAQHERSRFARDDGRWSYLDGVSLS